jgi:hypothetical protein
MATNQSPEMQFIPTAPSFAICTVCDTQHPIGTQQCAKCSSPLSIVRKCPTCERIVSAKHQRCVYCSTSLVQEGGGTPLAIPQPVVAGLSSRHDTVQKRRAILVSVSVFLIVMFLGLYATTKRVKKNGGTSEVAATSYMLHSAPLKLQPNDNAGTSTTLDRGLTISLTNTSVDPEGHRWYVLRTSRGDEFLKTTDVAPPKIRLPELGSQMLRAWLLTFRDPDLVPEADSAVTYFCAKFPESAHCNELRLLAAEQFRSMAQRTGSEDTLERVRHLYQQVIDSHGPEAAGASSALQTIGETTARPSSRRSRTSSRSTSQDASYESMSEYALVDHAEVHVRVPDLNAVGASGSVRTPIAREIRVHGKVAVPSSATCILKVSNLSTTNQATVELTAIEFNNRHYNVSTAPQKVPSAGATVVFPLESSLLIGK